MKDTKTKILDVAEQMIAELGAKGASLRKISTRAGVNIAAINYHFGSKNAMISAIIERLLTPLVQEMIQSLDLVMKTAARTKPEVEPIVRCFLTSLLNFSEQYPNHKAVFTQLFHSYDDDADFRRIMTGIAEKEIRYYGESLLKALPGLPEPVALARIAFFRNTAFGIMAGDCIMEKSIDVLGIRMSRHELMEEMVTYISAGLRAGC